MAKNMKIDRKSGEVQVDFKDKKVKDSLKDINKAQSEVLATLTEMVNTMDMFGEIAPANIQALQQELDRLDLEKPTRKIKTQQKEIKKVLDDITNASAKANNILNDTNVDPVETIRAYRDLSFAIADATAQVEMIAINNERSATQVEIENLKRKETVIETIRQQAALETNQEAQQKLIDQIKEYNREVINAQNKLNEISEQEQNVRETAAQKKADVNSQISGVNTNLPTADKNKVESVLNSIKDGLRTFTDAINAINISNISDSLNIKDSDRKQIRREAEYSFGLSHAEFNDYKNETIKAMTGGLEGLFGGDDIKQYLQDANKFGFESAEQATKMSQDIMIGNKLLGISNETQVAAYQLQRRLGDDTVLKKQNDRIAGLLSDQLGVSREQLDAIEKENMTLADAAIMSGADPSKINDMMAQLDAMKLAAEKAGVEDPTEILKEYMAGSIDERALMATDNYNEAEAALMQGDMQKLLEALQGSALVKSKASFTDSATSIAAARSIDGSDAQYRLARQMDMGENKQEYDKFYNEFLEAEKNGSAQKTAEEQLEKMTLQEKWANGISIKMEEMDWGIWIGLDETAQLIQASVKVIEGLVAVIAAGKLIKNIFVLVKNGFKTLGKGIKDAGGMKGVAGKIGGLLGKHEAGAIPTATKAIGGASLIAGLAWTGIDAYKGAKNGITDDQGNQVMKSGFGSGLASAVSGSKVATTESTGGSDLGASVKNIGGGALNGAGKGALIGAGIGSFITPGIGTAIGGAVGGAIGAISGAIGGIFKDQERKKYEQEKKNQKIQEEANKMLVDINRNTFNTERAIGSLGTAVSVRWRPEQLEAGGGTVSNYIAGNSYSSSSRNSVFGVGGPVQFGIGGSHGADPSHKPPITAGWPSYPSGKPHKGVDFGVVKGTPVGAAISGTVETVGTGITRDGWLGNKDNGGWGNYVMVRGEDGNRYTYAHMSKVLINKGDKVNAGTQLGLSGNTGNTSGPHLHFQVDDASGKNIDPFDFITAGIFDIGNTAGPSGPSSSTDSSDTSSSTDFGLSQKTTARNLVKDSMKRRFTYDVSGLGGGTADNSPIVSGLADIKKTLIDLADRQSYQQKLIDAMSTHPIKLSY